MNKKILVVILVSLPLVATETPKPDPRWNLKRNDPDHGYDRPELVPVKAGYHIEKWVVQDPPDGKNRDVYLSIPDVNTSNFKYK